MDLSVIICTYNRCENLAHTLESLRSVRIPPGVAWEVLVVDNNSTDQTKAVVESFVRKGFQNLRYVFERQQGKSLALNTGVRETQGSIIVFTDDDCIVPDGWVTAILREFKADPTLAGVGGRVELYNESDQPVATRTAKERIVFSSVSFEHLFGLIIGCNMALRREVFDTVGGFDPHLGPGTKVSAIAEDIEFLYRVYKSGLKIVYSPDFFVYHNHGRRTEHQVQIVKKGYAIGRGALYCKYILQGDRDMLRLAYRESLWTTKSLFRDFFAGKSIKRQRTLLWALFRGALYELST